MALAVNQMDSHRNCMAFLHTWTETMVVHNMLGSGAREPTAKNARCMSTVYR